MSNRALASARDAPFEPATEPAAIKTKMTLAIISYMTWWNARGYLTWGARDRNLGLSIFTPLLGNYNSSDPSATDWHIKWAVEHGVTVFFVNNLLNAEDCNDRFFAAGFLRSAYIAHVQFAFHIDAPTWYENETEMFQDLACDLEYWSTHYFNHTSYFRIGSRPVIKISGLPESVEKWGAKAVDRLLTMAREIPEVYGFTPYIIGDIFAGNGPAQEWARRFDALYNNDFEPKRMMFQKSAQGCMIAPYQELVANQVRDAKEWSAFAKSVREPFIPTVMTGFNNEKLHLRGYDDWCVKFTDPTPDLFKSMIEGVEPYVDSQLRLIFINSWNELNEGHSIEPTKEYGFTYLDMIRDLFAIHDSETWPPNLAPTLEGRYVEFRPDGTTSVDIPINKAWWALQADANIVAAALRNSTSPVFKSGEANSFFREAVDEYDMAFRSFLKNNFENSVSLAHRALQLMNSAYDAENRYGAQTSASTVVINPPAFEWTYLAVAFAAIVTIVGLSVVTLRSRHRC